MVNADWRIQFSESKVCHLSYYNSDHRALLLDLDPRKPFRRRPFRVEAIWMEDDRFKELVSRIWSPNYANEHATQSDLSPFPLIRVMQSRLIFNEM